MKYIRDRTNPSVLLKCKLNIKSKGEEKTLVLFPLWERILHFRFPGVAETLIYDCPPTESIYQDPISLYVYLSPSFKCQWPVDGQ